MMLAKEAKQDVIKEFGKNDKDSGATEVQIALLTKRIEGPCFTPGFAEDGRTEAQAA